MTNETNEIEDWGDVEGAKPKKGMPKWLMFCGGGCLIALILGGVASFLAYSAFKDMTDPEIFWPKIDAMVHVDSPMPERFTPMMAFSVAGQEQRQFLDGETGLSVQLISPINSEEAKTRESLFGEDPEFPGMMLDAKNSGMMMIQGREVPFVDASINLVAMSQRALFLDVSSEGGELVIMIIQGHEGSTEIPREDVDSILQVFHIGPDR